MMKITNYQLLIFVFCFFLIVPPFFSTIAELSYIFGMAQYAILFSLIFYSVILSTYWKVFFSRPAIYFLLFYLVMFVTTYLNNQTIQLCLYDNKSSIALLLLTVIEMKRHPKEYLKTLSFFNIYQYINLATIILFPSGLYLSGSYLCWFLGYKNPMVRIVLPLLLVSIASDMLNKKKLTLKSWCHILCACLCILITKSGTGLTGLFVFFTILLIGFHGKKIYKVLFSIKVIYLIILVLVLGLVVYQVHLTNSFFSSIVENFYGKSTDFTARTTIWSTSMELITEKPIIGYGFMNSSGFAKLFNYSWSVAHSHNYYFYILLTGGSVLFSVILAILVYFARTLRKKGYSKMSVLSVAYLVSLLIMGISESLTEFVMLYASLYMICIFVKDDNTNFEGEKLTNESYQKIAFNKIIL